MPPMIDIKGTLLLIAVILALLIVLTRGCSSRVDKFREYRDQRRSERHDRIDQWREHRGENRWRWRDRRGRDQNQEQVDAAYEN